MRVELSVFKIASDVEHLLYIEYNQLEYQHWSQDIVQYSGAKYL
jgi:hypothetical protein